MKKKGFTLVELLAVIIILSLVLVIAVPSVNRYIKQSKEKAYNTQISTIIEAAQAYASANSGLLPRKEEFVVKITLGQLKSSGLIKEEVKNPNDDKYFDDALTIEIKKKGETYNYDIVESTITRMIQAVNDLGIQKEDIVLLTLKGVEWILVYYR